MARRNSNRSYNHVTGKVDMGNYNDGIKLGNWIARAIFKIVFLPITIIVAIIKARKKK